MIFISGYKTEKHCAYPVAHAPLVAMAGGDLFMPGSKHDYQELKQAFDQGTLIREQLEINVSRLIQTIEKLTKE